MTAAPRRAVLTETGPPDYDSLVSVTKAVADPLRAALLRVLREGSYGVLELCQILGTAQPALSHHLKLLHQAGMLARRREGNSVFYRRAPAPSALEQALLDAVDAVPLGTAQQTGLDAVHAARRQRSEAFFAQHADDFARHQGRISEASVYVPAILDLVERHGLGAGTALEIGPGNGELLRPLAARFRRVVAVDSARTMLERTARQIGDLDNVRLEHREFAAMTTQHRFQLLVAAMVVHHMASPPAFFQQARRLLSAGGLLVVAELCGHQHEWTRDACGDLWLGFEPQELADWARSAGLVPEETQFLAQKNGFQIQIHGFRHPPRRSHG